MEGAGLPLGRHRGTHAILLSHRGVPGSAQWGPAAGLLGSRGHIQSGETEFHKGSVCPLWAEREGTDAELLTRARASLGPGRQREWSTEPERERLPGRSCGCRQRET